MKRLLTALVLLLAFFPSVTFGACAFDDSSIFNPGGNRTSATVSHTTSGSDRVLLVNFWTSGAATVNSVTYGGVGMTLLETGASASERYHLYYLANPTSGTNDIVISVSASVNIVVLGTSYTGVDQTTPIDSSDISLTAQNASPMVQSVTSTVDSACAFWFPREYTGKTLTAGTDTVIHEGDTTQAGVRSASSDGPLGTAGSHDLTINLSAGTPGWWRGTFGTLTPAAEAAAPAEDIIWFFF